MMKKVLLFIVVCVCMSTQYALASLASKVVTNKSEYSVNEKIVATISDGPSSKYAWVGIFSKGADDVEYQEWSYTSGASNKSFNFSGLPAGEYEVRLFKHGGYIFLNAASFSVKASSVATGSSSSYNANNAGSSVSATVVTDKHEYSVNEKIVATISDGPSSKYAWVGIFSKGADDVEYQEWSYTSGASNKSFNFSGLPAGEYEVRLFKHGGYIFLNAASFSVKASSVATGSSSSYNANNAGSSVSATVVTDKHEYSVNEKIVATISDGPSSKYAWVGIFSKGADDVEYQEWSYTSGASNKSFNFSGLPAGEYEVRLFKHGGYIFLNAASFSVKASSSSSGSWNAASSKTIHNSATVNKSGGVVSKKNTTDNTTTTTTTTAKYGGVETEFGLFRNVEFFSTTASISAGGFSYAFDPFDKNQRCGVLSYSAEYGGVNVVKSLTCDDKSVTAALNFSVSQSLSQSIPTGYGPSVDIGLTITAGVGLSLQAGVVGQFDSIPYPIYVGSIRKPDFVKVAISPSIAVGGSAALNVIDLVVYKLGIGGSVNLVRLQPRFSIELGYRKLTEDGVEYQSYVDNNGIVTVSGGDGSIWVRKTVLLVLGWKVDLVKWDPVYKVNANLYDKFTLTERLRK